MSDGAGNSKKITESFHNLLYKGYENSQEFHQIKPKLAHYTSIDTVLEILKNNQLWFSNPLLMNDNEELRFGLDHGANLLNKSEILRQVLAGERYQKFVAYFNGYFKHFIDNAALDTYLFCFSEHGSEDTDGKLSMWRGYGADGRGAAIVFDTEGLLDMDNSALILARVDYRSTEERIEALKALIDRVASWFVDFDVADDELYIPASLLFDRFLRLSLFTKHSGFSEEREWRVVYFKARDASEEFASMFDFITSSNGIEPKLKLNIEPMLEHIQDGISMSGLVDKIILGPTMASAFSKAAFVRALEKSDLTGYIDRVEVSSIPYRPK